MGVGIWVKGWGKGNNAKSYDLGTYTVPIDRSKDKMNNKTTSTFKNVPVR